MTSRRVSLITPTADQPMGIRLLEGYVARQTVQPHEWIVADDGNDHATLTMGQTHIKRARTHEGGRSLASNVAAALERVTGDVVIIFEHDDWYAPDHIETCLAYLQGDKTVTGSMWQRYYNIQHRCWIVMQNVGSALCNTAFTADRVDTMREACDEVMRSGGYGLDRVFWESIPRDQWAVTDTATCIGIKGLPGRKGLGIGHRPTDSSRQWHNDPEFCKLHSLVGPDVEHYRNAWE